MLSLLFLAAAVIAGAPLAVVGVVALAVYQPLWFLAGAAAWGVASRLRRPGPSAADDEARFLQAMADELRAGGSLRAAVEAAAARSPGLVLAAAVRRARTGQPMQEVASELRQALPVNGRLAGPALSLAAATGGRTADVLAGLAGRAAVRGELARERRALTAQAQLSALVVAGAPLLLAGALVMSGGSSSLLELGRSGVIIGGIGLALEAAGVATVWVMIRRAER